MMSLITKSLIVIAAGCLMLAISAGAVEIDRRLPMDPLLEVIRGDEGVLHGRPQTSAAKSDTIYLLGGPGRLDGRFQNAAGLPEWHGWTSEDLTFQPDAYWSVTAEPHLVINGDWSLWCGVVYPEPGPIPVPGFGYGNEWRQDVVFSHSVAVPGADSDVVWSLVLRHDTEPGYDFVYLEWNQGGVWSTLDSFDGVSPGVLQLEYGFTVSPGQYAGPAADEIQLRIRFFSDGAWSDEDGLHPTERGACQVDDIVVIVDGVVIDNEDFESGTMGAWVPTQHPGVGDFAALWTNLGDLDPCVSNWTPQVAFIDDGIVVPGTGGTMCITWCYGPGGYIVNNSGGLLGEGHHLDNGVISPVLTWPAQADAARLSYEVYLHDDFAFGWPGMVHRARVRSIASGDPADLASAPWREGSLIYVYPGGPGYRRLQRELGHLLEPGRTHLQVSLGVTQMGWIWGWDGDDGTPAPYFDNVAVAAYAYGGPDITASEVDLAQDSFPASPGLDFENLASNAVRFDMARNVAPAAHGTNDPGDSIVVDVKAIRAGSSLADRPRMHVKMKANPLFDGVRMLPPGFVHTPPGSPGSWGVIEGWVYGDTTYNAQGGVVADRWNFDLPDEDFFYPGDVIHYYFEAEDDLGGVTILPGALTGFGDFDDEFAHDRRFIVRALPTMFSTVPGDQPRILFWDDSRGILTNKWLHALRFNGLRESVQFDQYYTNGASAGVGNGLGGRAVPAHLDHYDVLFYTCGDLSRFTLSNGDPNHDPGDDIDLVTAFLAEGKQALLSGDDLVYSLNLAGPAGQSFVSDLIGVTLVNRNVRSFIGEQIAPRVSAIPGNGVIVRIDQWVAQGGCPRLNTFDAVTVDAAQRLAEYTNQLGQPGWYPYAAATRNVHPVSDATVVLLPHAFTQIDQAPGWTPPPGWAGVPARAIILGDILDSFDQIVVPPVGVRPALAFAVSNHPNPLNPATTIRLNLPRAGKMSLKVYNLRGELVRTLVEERLEDGGHELVWDGTSDRGAAVASGLYFYEARHGGEVRVGKMTVLK